MSWTWQDITRQLREPDDNGKMRVVTLDDDLVEIVGMLHEMRGDTSGGGCPMDAAIHQCKQPTDYCRINVVAYQSSLGGWACTQPPLPHEVPAGAHAEAQDVDGTEVITCSRCVLNKWQMAPQSGGSFESKAPGFVTVDNGRKRAIKAWLTSEAEAVISFVKLARRLNCGTPQNDAYYEVAAWCMGITTPCAVMHGDPDARAVSDYAKWLQDRARKNRPWEGK